MLFCYFDVISAASAADMSWASLRFFSLKFLNSSMILCSSASTTLKEEPIFLIIFLWITALFLVRQELQAIIPTNCYTSITCCLIISIPSLLHKYGRKYLPHENSPKNTVFLIFFIDFLKIKSFSAQNRYFYWCKI